MHEISELKLRDSGISMDDDDSQKSLSTSTSSISDCKSSKFSYVQSLKFRFEHLNDGKVHTNCNWWLEEVNEDEEHEAVACKINEATNIHSINTHNHDSVVKNSSSEESDNETFHEPKTPAPTLTRQISSKPPPPVPPRPLSKLLSVELQQPDHSESDDHHSDSFESGSSDDEDDKSDEHHNTAEIDDIMQKSRSSRPTSTTSSQHSNFSHSKLFNILSELFENEKNYVKTLKNGIDNYMSALDRDELPKSLRGQKFHIFANIQGIYNFHKNEFLPALLACDEEEPIQIAEVFTNYVVKEYFYSYVIYAINRKRSEFLCKDSMDFWREIQNECNDRLGINSFLLQPIQRLPRYQLLLNEIIKDLSKDMDNTKLAMAAFCIAEKNIQRLLDTVNESMSINDIKNCFEIDVLCQGKFRKVNEFDMFDWETRRRFRGKVFLFENCIVYTEVLNREFMEYRGHFGMNIVGIICKEGKSKFKLFAKRRGLKEVEFRSSLAVVNEWNEQITGMLMKFVREEKRRNEFRRKSSVHVLKSRASDSLRSSMMSNRSDYSISSYDSGSRTSDGGSLAEANHEFVPNERNSQWYI